MLLNTLATNRVFAVFDLVQKIKEYQITHLIPDIEADGELMEVLSYHLCYRGLADNNMHMIELVFIPKDEDWRESCIEDLYKGNSGSYTSATMQTTNFIKNILYPDLDPKDYELKNKLHYDQWFSSLENFTEFSNMISPLLDSHLGRFS